MNRFALLKLGGRCDNDCLFCHARGPRNEILPTREAFRRVLAVRDRGLGGVLLSGGEPTNHPEVLKIAKFIRKAGLSLGLITNGRALAGETLRTELLELGMERVHLSLHGSSAKRHDPWTGQGSFDAALETLTRLSTTEQLDLSVTTVVAGFNLDDLSATVALVGDVLRRGGLTSRASHRLALIEPKGRALSNPAAIPRLDAAADSLGEALIEGQRRFGGQIILGYDGLPLCLTPPPPARLLNLAFYGIVAMQEVHDQHLFATDESERARAPQCESCTLRESCPGVYRGYLPQESSALRPLTKRDLFSMKSEKRSLNSSAE